MSVSTAASNSVPGPARASHLRPHLTQLRWPRSMVARFVARRTVRSAVFLAAAFSGFVASKVIGYAHVYPTVRDRLSAAALLENNVGFKALFGAPHHLDTVSGYAAWYAVPVGVLLGGIWACLIATRTFRGEEAAGRWELLLAGQTTARRATAHALVGLGASLTLLYAIVASTLVLVGRVNSVGYGTRPALFFALAAISAAAMFVAVGAFASQLMPTRSRAASLATAFFGVCFLVRAAGDITSAHWLLNITPLGWIEQLQPLFGPQPIWLLPIAGLTAALGAATVYLAGRRDLGASFIADRAAAKPHTLLLRGPFTAAIRLTRTSVFGWFAAIMTFLVFYGALANTAAKMVSDSAATQHLLAMFTRSSLQETGARTFLGFAFMLLMLLLMAYSASAVGSMREDEAQGYLDNLLVRCVGRQRWLWGRVVLVVTMITITGLLSSMVVWLSMTGHHYGISLHDLLMAGLNSVPPAIFTIGVGLFTFGLVPRLTTVVAYGVIAWSFLIQMLSSGTNLNHWVLDTSVFTHIAFAPAADPKWSTGWVFIGLGALLAIVGALAFNRRDLAGE